MFRLSKLADYAVLILAGLGRHKDVVTSAALAAETWVPEPTVAKILKTLAAGGLVVSQRGARGGYRLAAPLEDVSLARVISVMDGPIFLTACVSGGGGCDNTDSCTLYGSWDVVNDAIHDALSGISIARMMQLSQTIRDRGAEAAPPGALPQGQSADEAAGTCGG